MQTSARTPKGTELPLLNMRGKPYLQVAHRLVWINEDAARFMMSTDIVKAEKDESIVKAHVVVYDVNGQMLKQATAVKREDSKGFADHLEKAETGAIGRALAMLGYGTQFTLPDLDEGERLADSPTAQAKPAPAATPTAASSELPAGASASTTQKVSSFRKSSTKSSPVATTSPAAAPSESEDGWA